MDQLHIIETQFNNNYQAVKLITPKFISRHIIWNYLKDNNQIGDINWQTVKYVVLKMRLIEYWQKKKKLSQHLPVSELGQLLTCKTMYFNEEEINLLHLKLQKTIQESMQNVETLHPMLIHHIIEVLLKVNKPEYQNIIDLLNKNIQKRLLLLLEQMVQSKICSTAQKEEYLMLKRIDYDNVDQEFNKYFQSDKTKFILSRLKVKSKSLYENVSFNIS